MTLAFEVKVELTAIERDVVGRVGEFLGSLMAAWQSSTPEKRKEAILELQGDLNDLRDLNLTLAIGSAEQQLLPPENLPSKPIPVTTLAATRMRRGTPAGHWVLPCVTRWDGSAVRVHVEGLKSAGSRGCRAPCSTAT